MTLDQIANLLGMSPESLVRLVNAHASVTLDASTVQKIFIDQFRAASEQATVLFGDRSVAMHWLQDSRIECFGGSTGLDLLLSGRGKTLASYIESLQAGYLG